MTKEGLSQVQIAEETMVSQKTISNDIVKLRAKGKL
jgi:DNA-binding CsgD family transcriptional regulator